MLNHIHIELEEPIIWKALKTEGGYCVAVCDELNLVIQSQDQADLEEDIEQAVFAMVAELSEQGMLNKFAQQRGWTVRIEPVYPRARTQKPPVHLNPPVRLMTDDNQSQGVFA
jgi:predicted RNase H-like HicB family nuclease